MWSKKECDIKKRERDYGVQYLWWSVPPLDFLKPGTGGASRAKNVRASSNTFCVAFPGNCTRTCIQRINWHGQIKSKDSVCTSGRLLHASAELVSSHWSFRRRGTRRMSWRSPATSRSCCRPQWPMSPDLHAFPEDVSNIWNYEQKGGMLVSEHHGTEQNVVLCWT